MAIGHVCFRRIPPQFGHAAVKAVVAVEWKTYYCCLKIWFLRDLVNTVFDSANLELRVMKIWGQRGISSRWWWSSTVMVICKVLQNLSVAYRKVCVGTFNSTSRSADMTEYKRRLKSTICSMPWSFPRSSWRLKGSGQWSIVYDRSHSLHMRACVCVSVPFSIFTDIFLWCGHDGPPRAKFYKSRLTHCSVCSP